MILGFDQLLCILLFDRQIGAHTDVPQRLTCKEEPPSLRARLLKYCTNLQQAGTTASKLTNRPNFAIFGHDEQNRPDCCSH